MGGTSTDVALCQNGQPTIGRETAIGHFRIKVPSVNVHTVGAGGGSIAHVPELTKALRVGPQSAGAEPGPAAYGKGGTEPTVTDANVVLGHLPPRLLGGEMELDVDAARAAVQKIADAMGLDSVEQAAEGILAIVNENMAGALRLVSVQRGHDPRDFALVAYGGAGPLHANALAKLMGSFPVIVPPAPGLLCAIGDLVADFRDEFAQTYIRLARRREPATRSRTSSTALGEQREGLARRRGDRRGRRSAIAYTADMRYHRQGYEIPVALDPGEVRGERPRRPRGALQRAARAALRLPDAGHRVARSSTCARSATAPCRSPSCRSASSARRTRRPRSSTSTRSSSTASASPTKIYDRAKLEPGAMLDGPGDRHRVRLDDRRPARLPRRASTRNFNILITPND